MRLRRFSGGVGLSVSIGFLAGRFVPVFFLRGIERGRLRVCRSSRRAADGWPGAHARRRQCRCRRPIRARSVAAWGVATSAGAHGRGRRSARSWGRPLRVRRRSIYPGRGRCRRIGAEASRTVAAAGSIGADGADGVAAALSPVEYPAMWPTADRSACRRAHGAAVGGLSGRDPWPPGASPRPQGHTDGADARRDPGAVRCAFFCCNALMACRIFGAFWGRLARLARCGPKC